MTNKDIPMQYNEQGTVVLVIENNSDDLLFMESVLMKYFILETVSNAEDLLVSINKRLPDIIILSSLIPDINGNSLLEYLKSNKTTADIPVILTSGSPESNYIDDLNSEAADYLFKPFSAKELMARVSLQLKILKAKKECNRKWVTLFNQIPCAISIIQLAKSRLVMANPRMLELWHKTAEQVMNKPLFEGIPELRNYGFERLIDKVKISGKRSIGKEIFLEIVKDEKIEGIYVKFIFEPIIEEEGKVSGIIIFADEITEQVIARTKIEENEIRLRLATEGAKLATWDLDLTTQKIIYSPILATFFGLPASTKLNHTELRNLIHPNDIHNVIDKAFSEAMETGDYNYEARVVYPDNSIHWVKTMGKVFYDENKVPLRLLGAIIDTTASKEAEEKVAKLAAIVESSEDAIISKTLEGIVSSWNVAAERIFGYTADEMIGQPIVRIFPPERMEEEVQILKKIERGERVDHFETQRLTKENRLIDISLMISPIKDSYGNIIGVSKVARDISSNKRAERLIYESEERLRLAIESAELGTWEMDIQTGNILTSPQLRLILGIDNQDWNNDKFLDIVYKDDRSIVLASLQQLGHEHKLFYEARIIRMDGELRWIRVNGKTINDEKYTPLRLIGTMMDITESKELSQNLKKKVDQRTKELNSKNEQLIRQKEFVDTILNASIDMIAVFDENLRYVKLNKKAYLVYNKDQEDILGKSIIDVFPDIINSDIFFDLNKALKGEIVQRSSYNSFGFDNIHLRNFYIPLKNKENEVYNVLMISHDITAIVESSEKLKLVNQVLEEKNWALQRSNNDLESFSYAASHDLQEPLRKIQTFLNIVEKNLQDKELVEMYFTKINSSAKRMGDLIKSILNYSRITFNIDEFVDVDLNSILEDIKADFELLIIEKNAVINSMKLPLIKGIPSQINQLFYNLISNSLKFSKTDPVINISAQIISNFKTSDFPYLNNNLKYVKLEFSDNGIGFEQQYADKVFAIFQRLHDKQSYAGTGIGLALCKKIIENHHGHIHSYSELGKGATFFIFLPLK